MYLYPEPTPRCEGGEVGVLSRVYASCGKEERMTETARVLLVEDDLALAATTREYLESFGFLVLHEADGKAGLALALAEKPDVILLDLMLPSLDGLEICRRLRKDPTTAGLPLLMLTARTAETDRVVGLEMGADDYLSKPYSLRELVARIRALLRRRERLPETTPPPPPASIPLHEGDPFVLLSKPLPSGISDKGHEILRFEELLIDRTMRSVRIGDYPVHLTATEFELLWCLMQHPGQVFSREQLLDRIRGRDFEVFDRSIDMHVSKLRRKLEAAPQKIRWIKTIWGVGYQFLPEESGSPE